MLADEAEHGKMADVVLVYRSDFQKQDEKIEMLTGDLATLQGALSSQVEEIRKECDERTSMARRSDQEEISELRQRYDGLMQASQAKEREHLRIIKSLEASHCSAAEQLESLYEKKIAHDADRYNELQEDRTRLEGSIEQMRGELQKEFDREKHVIQQEWQKQMDDKQLEVNKLKDRMAYLEHRYEAMLSMEEADHELETEKRKMEFDVELKTQVKKETLMRKEQDSLIRGLDMMMKDKEKVAKEQADAAHQIRRLATEGEELKRQVQGLQKERKQQEKRITDYKQKVSTLKKFKYVLDFRLREVSESLMRKERQIEQLKAQLQDTEAEFEKQLNTQQHLQQTMELRNQKIAQLQEEVKKQESSVKAKVKKLYHKYVKKERTTAKSDTRGVEEITKQMGLMEKKITSFAVKSERAELACKTDTQRKALENSLLIHELNELRYEKKNLESKLRNYELQMSSGGGGSTST